MLFLIGFRHCYYIDHDINPNIRIYMSCSLRRTHISNIFYALTCPLLIAANLFSLTTVYAADAKLDRIVTYTKTLAGLRWGKNNSRVGEGRCSLNGQLLSTGVISEECAEKGRYYTWQEAQTACPVNYRLPTVSEYLALFDATGGANDTAGRQLKSVGFGNGTNEHSFNAIATGWANAGSTTLTNTNIETAFWTADENAANNTEAARVFLQENNSQIPWSPTFYANRDKNKRYSVRCVK